MINNLYGCFSKSFIGLNIAQTCGALNDNLYKLLTIFLFIEIEGIENSAEILSLAGAIFVMPFLLFAAFAGILADKFSKCMIIRWTKVFEVLIALIGMAGLYLQNKEICYFSIFLFALQSTIFGPAKYGILPEILDKTKLSQANGIITALTYLAIITGTFLASFILEITDRSYLTGAFVCLSVSLIGFLGSLAISYTHPQNPKINLRPVFIGEIFKTLKELKVFPPLLSAIFASAFFLFAASFVQLNLIPFAAITLNLTDTQGGYLFILTAIGIAFGSFIIGKLSGKKILLKVVPYACMILSFQFFLLDFLSDQLGIAAFLVFGLGAIGGIYQIPLDAYVQSKSPKEKLGSVIAANSFLSFAGVLFASFLVFLIGGVFKINPDKGFTLMGALTLTYSFYLIAIFQENPTLQSGSN